MSLSSARCRSEPGLPRGWDARARFQEWTSRVHPDPAPPSDRASAPSPRSGDGCSVRPRVDPLRFTFGSEPRRRGPLRPPGRPSVLRRRLLLEMTRRWHRCRWPQRRRRWTWTADRVQVADGPAAKGGGTGRVGGPFGRRPPPSAPWGPDAISSALLPASPSAQPLSRCQVHRPTSARALVTQPTGTSLGLSPRDPVPRPPRSPPSGQCGRAGATGAVRDTPPGTPRPASGFWTTGAWTGTLPASHPWDSPSRAALRPREGEADRPTDRGGRRDGLSCRALSLSVPKRSVERIGPWGLSRSDVWRRRLGKFTKGSPNLSRDTGPAPVGRERQSWDVKRPTREVRSQPGWKD